MRLDPILTYLPLPSPLLHLKSFPSSSYPCPPSSPQERLESSKWTDPASKASKSKEDKEEKRKAELARKAENARLLALEEASAPSKPKPSPAAKSSKGGVGAKSGAGAKGAAGKKGAEKPAGPGAIAAGGGLGGGEGGEGEGEAGEKGGDGGDGGEKVVESYSATGIDNALDLLEVVTAKMDKASVGSKAAEIERHPEVRFSSLLFYLGMRRERMGWMES